MNDIDNDTTYLGDGAYIKFSPYGEVIIFTHNGIETNNRVVLGVAELLVLMKWLKTNVHVIE